MAERTVVKMTFLIPQIVLTELDHFSDPELEVVARKAREYIQVLKNKGTGLVIETPQDAEQANSLYKSKLNDDKILKCCLLMKQRGKDVVLFSDDHMLLIKAQINSLKAFSTKDIVVKIFDLALPKSEIMTPAKLFSMIESDIYLPTRDSDLKETKLLLKKVQ
ncbi:hypothetical protein QYM36_016124 [Artemia franciscana]|uniref:PIN domain-containing protein n=1 Tax=Artemia franciscana TaxID=6661 RepID=A0AA88HIL9_ARTSF|nr:hypothetical protein QYM36_016124 [Artemia franciscana]